MNVPLTKSERETLKAIYRLTAPARGRDGADAHTGALAEALGVSPGTATATVKRLAEPGDVAVVAVPGSTDPEVVAFLGTLGLRPGVRVEVREKHPFDGPLVLRVDGHDRTVGEKLARQIYVRPARAAAGGTTRRSRREQPA